MAYKFQLGNAQLSGTVVQEGAIKVHNESGTQVGILQQDGIVSGSGAVKGASLSVDNNVINSDGSGNLAANSFGDGTATLQSGALTGLTTASGSGNWQIGGTLHVGNSGFSIDADGDTTVKSLNASSGGITNAGAIAGATTISGSGAISGPNLTLGGGTWTEAGVLSPDGAISAGGSVTAVGSFVIGSADMNEADLEKLDGITNGTAAASKAVVLDASKNIGTIGELSASVLSGSEVHVALDSLHINGTAVTSTAGELNILDGVTATAAELNYSDIAALGTGAVSKALVFDADGQFEGVTNGLILSASVFSGSGAGLTNIDVTNLDAAGSNTEIQFNDNGEFAGSSMLTFLTGNNALVISGTYDGEQSSQMIFGLKNTGHFTIGVDDGDAEIATPHYGITISGSEAGGITLQGGGNKGVLVDSALGIRGLNAAGDGAVWSLLRTGVISGSGALQGASLDVDSVTVITAAQQLQNIASLDATTEATVEAAIDTLANLASAGAAGVDLDILGPLDVQEGIKQNGSQILSDAGALGGLTTISGSGQLSAESLSTGNGKFSVSSVGVVGFANGGGLNVSDDLTINSVSLGDGTTIVTSGGAVSASAGLSGTSLSLASVAVTATAAELNYVDVTPGTAAASKALVLDASSRIVSGVSQITASYFSGDGSGLTNITLANTDAAGSDTQIQFNQNGEFAANSNLTYDGSGSLTAGAVISATTGLDSAHYVRSSGSLGGTIVGNYRLGNDGEGALLSRLARNTSLFGEDRVVLIHERGPVFLSGSGVGVRFGSDVLSSGSADFAGTLACDTSFTLDAVTVNATELGYIDSVTAGTAAASKAVVLDASKNIGTIGELSASVLSGSEVHAALDSLHINGTAVTSTAGELNILDGVTATAAELNYNDIASLGTGAASKAVVFDADGQFDGASAGLILSSSAISGTVVNVPYSGLEINGVAVSSTAAELNILDGVTATAAELNYNDIASLGTGVVSKALVFDADGQFDGQTNGLILSASYFKGDGSALTNVPGGVAGSDQYVQFNQTGDQAADAGFQYNGTGSFVIGTGYSRGASNTGMLSRFTASADAGSGVFGGFYLGKGTLQAGSSYLIRGNFGVGQQSMWVEEDGAMMFSASTDQSIQAGDGLTITTVDGTAVNGGLTSNGAFVTNAAATFNNNTINVNAGANFNNSAIGVNAGANFGGAVANFNNTAAAIAINGTASCNGPMTFNNHAIVANRGATINGLAAHSLTVNPTASFNNIVNLNAQVNTNALLSVNGTSSFGGPATFNNHAAAFNAGLTSTTISASSTLQVGGGVTMQGLGSATVSLTDDLMIIDDGASGAIKTTSLANYATAIAGAGLSATAGAVKLNLHGLPNGTAINVAEDKFGFVDNGDNSSRIQTFAHLATQMAGGGITATNGVLSTDIAAVAVVADGGTLAEGYNYFADLGSSAGVTLPGAPTVGDVVHVKAAGLGAGVQVTINRAGAQVIDDDDTAIYIESPYGAVSLVYVASNEWRLF